MILNEITDVDILLHANTILQVSSIRKPNTLHSQSISQNVENKNSQSSNNIDSNLKKRKNT